jgi:hypothetical protein
LIGKHIEGIEIVGIEKRDKEEKMVGTGGFEPPTSCV